MNENKIYEIILYSRGGQGMVTGMEILADMAFEDGFRDVLSIPIIGAERRGAPIKAFLRLSPTLEIKSFSAITKPDVTLIFDQTLLEIPMIAESIKGGIVILNASPDFDYEFPADVDLYRVDATQIAVDEGLLVAGSPVLNVPMIGAYAKVMGHVKMDTLNSVLVERFGSKAQKNYACADAAFNSVTNEQAEVC